MLAWLQCTHSTQNNDIMEDDVIEQAGNYKDFAHFHLQIHPEEPKTFMGDNFSPFVFINKMNKRTLSIELQFEADMIY